MSTSITPSRGNQIKVGTLIPQTEYSDYEYDPSRGLVVRAGFDGSSTRLAYLTYQAYVNQGIACRLRYEHGRATLNIVDSTQSFELDAWELRSNDETLSPLLSPNIVADLTSIEGDYDASVAALNEHLQNGDSAEVAFTDPDLVDGYGGPTYQLYPYIQAGLTGYRNASDAEGYVLRHATNISSQSTDNIADFGTGSIYSTAQLLTEVQNSELWTNPLDERRVYKIMNFVQPKARPGWMIGWFKDRSTETNDANNRVGIVTEYTFGQFEMNIYSSYNG